LYLFFLLYIVLWTQDVMSSTAQHQVPHIHYHLRTWWTKLTNNEALSQSQVKKLRHGGMTNECCDTTSFKKLCHGGTTNECCDTTSFKKLRQGDKTTEHGVGEMALPHSRNWVIAP
jgi:hypothetical protein